jgi:hypothetical protein
LLSPFETQRRSVWGQNLIEQGKHNFGHLGLSWQRRALLAFKHADLMGKKLTANEIHEAVSPFVGINTRRDGMSSVMQDAVRHGIIRPTGRKKKVEGIRNRYPEYEVIGYFEPPANDRGQLIAIGMHKSGYSLRRRENMSSYESGSFDGRVGSDPDAGREACDEDRGRSMCCPVG